MTPMDSREAGDMRRMSLATQSPEGPGDAQHLLVRQRLCERVGDPVDRALRAPRDDAQAAPVEVEVQPAAGGRVDADLRWVVEDRRVAPGHPLDAVVLADEALADDDPVRAVLLAELVADRVDARLGVR